MPLKIKPTVLDRLKELEGDAKAKRISEALPILAKNSSKQLVPVDGSASETDDIANFRDTIAVSINSGDMGTYVIDEEDCQIFKSDASYAELQYFGTTMSNILYGDGNNADIIQYAPDIVLVDAKTIAYAFQATGMVLSGQLQNELGETVWVPSSYHRGNCPMLKVLYLELGGMEMDQVFPRQIYIVPKDFAFDTEPTK